MNQSLGLWQRLPDGFLKKKYSAWNRLDYEVKLLIIELANNQNFKCAFCSKDHGLIIEHDHEPEQGPWDRYTIHNVRGLVCQRCNWHLGFHEKDERGDCRGWDHVSLIISSHDYEDYVYAFECRLRCLHEEFLEKTCPNYWSRRLLIDKFDDWKDGWGKYPWRWGFEEIKEKRHGLIRTPMQAIRGLIACMQYVAEEIKKDLNYQPPEEFVKLMVRVKPLIDEARQNHPKD